jgi:N-methylhydantoinase B
MSSTNDQRRIGDSLALVSSHGKTSFGCVHCGHVLGPASENYKAHSRITEIPIAEVAPEFEASDVEMASKMVFREFICPGCGVRFDTEIARKGDPILWDIRLSNV